MSDVRVTINADVQLPSDVSSANMITSLESILRGNPNNQLEGAQKISNFIKDLIAKKFLSSISVQAGTYTSGTHASKLIKGVTYTSVVEGDSGNYISLEIKNSASNAVYSTFSGSRTGKTTSFTINADTAGAAGNVTLTANSIKSLATLISDHNTAFPANTLTLAAGIGTEIPSQNITLASGADAIPAVKSSLLSQGLTFSSKVGGIAGDGFSFEVVDSGGAGPLSYTEVNNGAIVLDLVGLTPTTADVVTLMTTTTPSAFFDVVETTPGSVIVASAVSFSGGADLVPAVAATFSGQKNSVLSSITVTADNYGPVGDVTLTQDGVKTVATLISDFNTANPTNTITLTSGIGTQIPTQNIVLAGGVLQHVTYGGTAPALEIDLHSVAGYTAANVVANHTFTTVTLVATTPATVQAVNAATFLTGGVDGVLSGGQAAMTYDLK